MGLDRSRGPGQMYASCSTRADARLKSTSSGTCARFVAGGMQHSHAHGGLKKAWNVHRELDGVDPVLLAFNCLHNN